MVENMYQFDLPSHRQSIIKVVGVGGGGSNAVNHMNNLGIKDVEFVVCNTDRQALECSTVPNKLQIGTNLDGHGAGANPEMGRNAAIESKEEIRDLLSKNTKMIFITAGMGGGTGTGAAPIIAQVAQELDILTVGIVTSPFSFEGKKKATIAEEGIRELKKNCDTVIVIMNDKLLEVYGNLSITGAFAQADNVLTTAAKSIAEIITVAGYVNVDFQDVKTVMKQAGPAVMGSAKTVGENRARRAATEALNSPLLNQQKIYGAEKILLSIMSGTESELHMDELTEITNHIQEHAGEEVEMIWGHGFDDSLENHISVTVIATGFGKVDENGEYVINQENETKAFDLDSLEEIRNEKKINTSGIMFENESESGGSEELEWNYDVDSIRETIKREVDEEEEKSFEQSSLAFDFTGEVEKNEEEEKIDSGQVHVDDAPTFGLNLEKVRWERERNLREQTYANKQLEINEHMTSEEEFKERLEVPAYERKKVLFPNTPHSSEKNISRLSLTDENQIFGNNKFFHDNVD